MGTKWDRPGVNAHIVFAAQKNLSRANPPPTVKIPLSPAYLAGLRRDFDAGVAAKTMAEWFARRVLDDACRAMERAHFQHLSRPLRSSDLVIWGWDA